MIRYWMLLILSSLMLTARGAAPVPDKVIVLTFDDSVASQFTVVRPLLQRYHFGATFFITEGFSFSTNKKDYMTWEQIKEVEKEKFTKEQASKIQSNIKYETSMGEFDKCGIVIEAIIENLEIKKSVFAQLEDIVEGDCIVSSQSRIDVDR